MRGWHAGGSANNTHIGFEICEDDLSNASYFSAVYKEAITIVILGSICGLKNVSQIQQWAAIKPPVFASAEKEKLKVLLLSNASRCVTPLISYLHSRGIDFELIEYCIQTERLI